MRTITDLGGDEAAQVILTRDELLPVEGAPEEFVAKPDPVGVDDIRLAVIGHRLDTPLLHEVGDLGTIEAFRLSGEAQEAAQGVKAELRAGAVGREYVAE